MHYQTLGRVFDATKRPTDAAEAYRLALTYEPSSQVASTGLAAALLRSGRAEEAVRAADEARVMTNESGNVDAEFRRGDVRFVSGWLADIRRSRR